MNYIVWGGFIIFDAFSAGLVAYFLVFAIIEKYVPFIFLDAILLVLTLLLGGVAINIIVSKIKNQKRKEREAINNLYIPSPYFPPTYSSTVSQYS